MAHLRRNEHLKLLATWCNAIATATLTVGVLAPAAERFVKFDPRVLPDLNAWSSMDFFLICVLAAVVIHLMGQGFIEALKEDSE